MLSTKLHSFYGIFNLIGGEYPWITGVKKLHKGSVLIDMKGLLLDRDFFFLFQLLKVSV